MKTNYELLAENPKALKHFCDLLIEHATVIGIDKEINKLSESLRTQLTAARACELDPTELLRLCRDKKHERLLVFATAVGTERGKRIGKQAGQNSIKEAHEFASLQLANLAPWLVETVTEEDGELSAPKGHTPGVAFH